MILAFFDGLKPKPATLDVHAKRSLPISLSRLVFLSLYLECRQTDSAKTENHNSTIKHHLLAM